MKQYVINVIERVSNYSYVIINANDEEEARHKALRAYLHNELDMRNDITGIDAFNCGAPEPDDFKTLQQID